MLKALPYHPVMVGTTSTMARYRAASTSTSAVLLLVGQLAKVAL